MRKHRLALKALAVAGIIAGAFAFEAASPPAPAPANVSAHTITTTAVGEAPDSLAGYDVAVESYWRYIESTVYLEGVVAQEQAAAAAAQRAAQQRTTSAPEISGTTTPTIASDGSIPAAWVPTATCEEGGRDDPYAGYFGILEWNGFDGYPTAGSAPLQVQLAWEAAQGQGPPDAPGQCHSY